MRQLLEEHRDTGTDLTPGVTNPRTAGSQSRSGVIWEASEDRLGRGSARRRRGRGAAMRPRCGRASWTPAKMIEAVGAVRQRRSCQPRSGVGKLSMPVVFSIARLPKGMDGARPDRSSVVHLRKALLEREDRSNEELRERRPRIRIVVRAGQV